ncbi:MAG: beta-lactamase family protein [Candidatus Aminicenantes bacterium]|nr:beta-lactamase family protein [Candidatus Aminicenantes bacterium]
MCIQVMQKYSKYEFSVDNRPDPTQTTWAPRRLSTVFDREVKNMAASRLFRRSPIVGSFFLFPLVFILLFMVLTVEILPAREVDPKFASGIIEELKAKIPQWLAETDVPGAAVTIVDDKGILWKEVYGHKVRGGSDRVAEETLFSIQSMSKSFTALGVLMAVQDGLLDLDVPITEYLPDFTVNSPFEEHPEHKMTLRHLLSHRAGFTHEAPLGSNYDDRPHTFTEHVLSISSTWLRYPVGYLYSYSNLGIDLAGYILQEKTGMPFWDYIEKNVLEPIGMSQSTMNPEKIQKSVNRAIGHVTPRAEVQCGIPVIVPMIPAGGVYTNIVDMAKYLQFHINKGVVEGRAVLSRRLIEEMHSVAFPEKHQTAGYGLCLVRERIGKTYYLQHGGGGYGFITSMCMYPELKMGVVTLTNSQMSHLAGVKVVEVINAAVEKLGKTTPSPSGPTVNTEQPLDAKDERVTKLLGFYDANVRIEGKDGSLSISFRRDSYPLCFFLDRGELVGIFGNNSELRVKPPLRNGNGSLVHLNRLSGTCSYYDFHKPEKSRDEPGPNKPEWQKYAGRYRTLAWGRMSGYFQRVAIKDGYLTLNGMRCFEHLSGLFLTFDGEALDFRGTVSTFRNIQLIKSK